MLLWNPLFIFLCQIILWVLIYCLATESILNLDSAMSKNSSPLNLPYFLSWWTWAKPLNCKPAQSRLLLEELPWLWCLFPATEHRLRQRYDLAHKGIWEPTPWKNMVPVKTSQRKWFDLCFNSERRKVFSFIQSNHPCPNLLPRHTLCCTLFLTILQVKCMEGHCLQVPKLGSLILTSRIPSLFCIPLPTSTSQTPSY